MGIIEKWGTGMRRIFSRCEKAGLEKPVVNVGGSTVSFIFMRKKNEKVIETVTTPNTTPNTTLNATSNTTPEVVGCEHGLSTIKQRILDAIRKNPSASKQVLAELIGGITKDGVKYHLVKLQKMGLLRHTGPVRGGHWEVLVRDGNDINAQEA